MRWDRSRAGQGGGFHTTFASTESGEGGGGGAGDRYAKLPSRTE